VLVIIRGVCVVLVPVITRGVGAVAFSDGGRVVVLMVGGNGGSSCSGGGYDIVA
jgi:hypothetical protein